MKKSIDDKVFYNLIDANGANSTECDFILPIGTIFKHPSFEKVYEVKEYGFDIENKQLMIHCEEVAEEFNLESELKDGLYNQLFS